MWLICDSQFHYIHEKKKSIFRSSYWIGQVVKCRIFNHLQLLGIICKIILHECGNWAVAACQNHVSNALIVFLIR